MSQPDLASDLISSSTDRVADLVRSLADVMRQSNITELDVDFAGLAIRLRKPPWIEEPSAPIIQEPTGYALTGEIDRGQVLTAPMVGTFYTSPTPSSPSFVAVGDQVVAGQTVGIIEAMKIMNEIAADQSGIVVEFIVGNAQPVEYGSPLIRLVPDRGDRP